MQNEFSKSCEEVIEKKTKVDLLEIIVEGTFEKPYYQLRYHELGSSVINIGYGSYYRGNVFEWRDKYFELVKEQIPGTINTFKPIL